MTAGHDYPDSLTVRPLTTWPGPRTPDAKRVRSQFSAPLKSTLAVLDRELTKLSAWSPVMEVAIAENQFRVDGRPRAAARAEHPGVVLSLPRTSVGALRYAADRYLAWQDNLRAIALGLEALRQVERYGITRRGEQYAGFKALPPGVDGPIDADAAATLLQRAAGYTTDLTDPARLDAVFRAASKKAHPDKGGTAADFDRLVQARDLLRKAVGQDTLLVDTDLQIKTAVWI